MENVEDTDTKVCAYVECDAVMHRDGQRQSVWEPKKYCSSAHAAAQRHVDNMAGLENGTCQHPDCGGEIIRRKGESIKNWQARKFCSAKCQRSGVMRVNEADYEPKDCGNPSCTKKIEVDTAHPDISKARFNFRKRKYCSTECQMHCKREKSKGRRSNEHRNQRPMETRRLSPVSTPSVHIPDAPAGRERPIWRPAGFSPKPIIPSHIQAWNERNVQQDEERAS